MRRGSPSRLSLVVLLGLLTMMVLAYLTGCGERTPDMDMAMFRAHTESEAVLIQGREAYLTYCVGCHGVNGDGKGPAAEF